MSKLNKSNIPPIAWGVFSIAWGVLCTYGGLLWIRDGYQSIKIKEVII